MDAVVRRVEDLDASTWNDPVRGIIQFRTLFDSAVTSTGTLTAGVAELTEHGWLGLHRHPQAENYHVVEGVGIVLVNGTLHQVSSGSSIFIPGDAPHGIRNASPSRLRFIYTLAVDSLADVQYDWL
jgi:quercetin dioxygenase-like cupin family protein